MTLKRTLTALTAAFSLCIAGAAVADGMYEATVEACGFVASYESHGDPAQDALAAALAGMCADMEATGHEVSDLEDEVAAAQAALDAAEAELAAAEADLAAQDAAFWDLFSQVPPPPAP